MPAGQKDIYYLSSDNAAAARASPQLEGLRARGIEVLLLTEHIDPWLVAQLDEIDGHRLTDAASGELSFEGLPPAAAGETGVAELPELCTRVAAELGERVAGVRTSRRLHESASCLVRDACRSRTAVAPAAGSHRPVRAASKPWLELNPSHPLIERLAAMPEGETFASLAALVADEASIADGTVPPDPAAFLKRLNDWLLKGTDPSKKGSHPFAGFTIVVLRAVKGCDPFFAGRGKAGIFARCQSRPMKNCGRA